MCRKSLRCPCKCPTPQPMILKTMNPDAGIDQIRSLAPKGDIDSQVELGWKHYEGEDTPIDYKSAL